MQTISDTGLTHVRQVLFDAHPITSAHGCTDLVEHNDEDTFPLVALPLSDSAQPYECGVCLPPETLLPISEASLQVSLAHEGMRKSCESFTQQMSRPAMPCGLGEKQRRLKACPAVCMHSHAFSTVNLRDGLINWSKKEVNRLRKISPKLPVSRHRALYGFAQSSGTVTWFAGHRDICF